MEVTALVWGVTLIGLIGVIIADLIIVDRRPHAFTPREATRWVAFYVVLALVFAAVIAVTYGAQYGGQFLAGYITEYSLSVDNLFVFMVIMSSFVVPEQYRHRVLLVGVVIALFLRGILIVLGAAAIERFAATFYLFGAFLVWTAITVWRSGDDEPDPDANALVRFVERHVPTTREYHGTKLITRVNGHRVVTPMLLVMLAIGTTDLLFALDSIPAVFGLTEEAYIVFTANAFALMGLRQLYFMLHGLLDRLIYLSKGLALVLGFIAFKLLLHALHETTDLDVPEISIATSLAVILTILAVTAGASIMAVRRNPELAARSAEALAEHEAEMVAGEELSHLRPEEIPSVAGPADPARGPGRADPPEQPLS